MHLGVCASMQPTDTLRYVLRMKWRKKKKETHVSVRVCVCDRQGRSWIELEPPQGRTLCRRVFFFSFLVSSAALTSLEFFICNTIEAVPVTMAVVIQRVPENMTLQRRRNKLGGRRVYIIHLHQGRRREFPLDALWALHSVTKQTIWKRIEFFFWRRNRRWWWGRKEKEKKKKISRTGRADERHWGMYHVLLYFRIQARLQSIVVSWRLCKFDLLLLQRPYNQYTQTRA